MHIGPDFNDAQFTIKAYDQQSITVNEQICYQNLLILHNTLTSPWTQETLSALTEKDFQTILQAHPQILIIGTGSAQLFLPQHIHSLFQKANVGLEVMNTGAACRTFNLLSAEGRDVAGLFFL